MRNVDLTAAAIPGRDATVADRDAFAQTFDGYEIWGPSLAPMATRAHERWLDSSELPDTLTELRGVLFFEQRQRNHVGEGIEVEQAPYEDEIYERLGRLLDLAVVDDEQATVSAWRAAHSTAPQSAHGGPDGDVARWVEDAARALESSDVLPRDLREHHLAAAVKDAINAEHPECATTRVIAVHDWPLLGRSGTDIVVDDAPGAQQPRLVFELKWCQQSQDKVYEAIWDLFKVGLIAGQYGALGYLVTGAPTDTWPHALCADLFSSGTVSALDLLGRAFQNGRPIWDWLLEGGYDRYPNAVPSEFETARVGVAQVQLGSLEWEMRVVRVVPAAIRLQLDGGWPPGARPLAALHP